MPPYSEPVAQHLVDAAVTFDNLMELASYCYHQEQPLQARRALGSAIGVAGMQELLLGIRDGELEIAPAACASCGSDDPKVCRKPFPHRHGTFDFHAGLQVPCCSDSFHGDA